MRDKMKKTIIYVTCFALGCLHGYLLKKSEEQYIEPPFDPKVLEVLSEYEDRQD